MWPRFLSIVIASSITLSLSGCITLSDDPFLTRLANEEWRNVGVEPKFHFVQWVGCWCIGSPAAGPDPEAKVMRIWIPLGTPERLIRPLMRYEMSKIAWQIKFRNAWWAQADAFLHFPPSEVNSWYWVFFPSR